MRAIEPHSRFRFAVRLAPKSGRNAVDGWRIGAGGEPVLGARVASTPETGKANEALVSLLVQTLDVAKSRIRIVTGSSSCMKIIEVDGDEVSLARRLAHRGKL